MDNLNTGELDRLCNEVLTSLEIREARLLNWGFIQGAQRLDDIDAQLPDLLRPLPLNSPEIAELWERARATGVSGRAILDNLMQRKLLFRSRGERYRTRFAETVRLLFLLRQRFNENDWRTGERLVGDIRILLQRRSFPRRDVSPDAVLTQLRGLGSNRLRDAVVEALLSEPDGHRLSLARFQAESIVRVLRNLSSARDSAVAIGAGTGAGKTKAFYIPALAYIAQVMEARPYVVAVALYPRTELLKDQLRESYSEARKLDKLLHQHGKRPIALGAYYADVPTDAAEVQRGGRPNWKRSRDRTGWLCPYLPCPACGHQSLVWLEEDLKKEEEENKRGAYGKYSRLVCSECGAQVGSEALRLTRKQMLRQPPDILFTTTEMLNRRLSNAAEHELFGLGTAKPPRLMLMDEIHLNEGIHGAQVAYLLRRWRFARRGASNTGLCIVGLSATITQAESFLARLTGVPVADVTYIAPAEADLVKEGIEYNVVVKGDSLSGTTLLSTSVRTAMLLCRVLDPLDRSVSRGAFGQRVFAFSDKLDVINRWYHIEREVENPVEPYSRFLFVQTSDPTWGARNDQGQSWWLVSQVHDDPTALTSGLRLDLTSSQYAGVDETANLVVASSTLEVGYNDQKVGGILQHKAPFSRAAFVQRKGRAGRTRTMRPWMILVTSAYGHDRWAFQHAESLFDPVLPPLDLPLENYYVRKIQASYALLDWVAQKLKQEGQVVNVWDLLRSDERMRDPALAPGRRRVVKLLNELLENEETLGSFKAYLRGALALNQEGEYEADLALWGEPRPLLLEVVPTIVRQLETNWQTLEKREGSAWQTSTWTDATSDRPLPEFVPATLFNDLKSPELLIEIPEARYEAGEAPELRASETLSVTLALSEFTPGKVNKRFARKDKIREAHWLELPSLGPGMNAIDLEALAIEYDPAPAMVTQAGESIGVYTPRSMTLNCTPRNVRPTSTAQFVWAGNFDIRSRHGIDHETEEIGTELPLRNSQLASLVRPAREYTHANGSWIHVTRFATSVQVSTRFEGGTEQRGLYYFVADGRPAALGFNIDVDALKFEVVPVDSAALRRHPDWRTLYESFGSEFFLHLIRQDERTRALLLSELETEWLWQVTLAVLTQTAIQQQISLAQAADRVRPNFLEAARTAMTNMFPHGPPPAERTTPDEEEEDGLLTEPEAIGNESDEGTEDKGYLEAKLLDLLGRPALQSVLIENMSVLWNDEHPRLDEWLSSKYAHSLGSALFAAFLELTPEVQPDDLYVDIADGNIWITEAAAGGVGLVAKLANAVAQHPRRFEVTVRRLLERCPRATLAAELREIASWVRNEDQGLNKAFASIRDASDLPRLEETRQTLASVLSERHIAFSRRLGVALNVKFLRPNSGPDTDSLTAALVAFWEAEETRLGCALDSRLISLAAVKSVDLLGRVKQIMERIGDGGRAADLNYVYNLFQSLLWADCQDGCPDCIEHLQRFQKWAKPSRALLRTLMPRHEPVLAFDHEDWESQLGNQLADTYQAWTSAAQYALPAFKRALWGLLLKPVDVEDQLIYPALDRIEQRGTEWHAHLTLPDLIEGE